MAQDETSSYLAQKTRAGGVYNGNLIITFCERVGHVRGQKVVWGEGQTRTWGLVITVQFC
jgi:hypothetical protein